MSIWKWLNRKRIRDYPRLFLIASSLVLLLNILMHRGWLGGLTGLLMWGDYIVYYAAGILYKSNVIQLYNPGIQEAIQLKLIAPTVPPGVTLYSYPPNAALFHAVFSYISLPISLVIWCLFSVLCIIVAAKLMRRYLVSEWLARNGLSTLQLCIIIFSSFAFIEGFAAGQMHSITLLLMVGVLIATMKEKWFIAGLLAAGLTYKPQFIIGFLIIWLVWKKYYAILTFILFSAIWHGTVLITKGIDPYIEYLGFVRNMVYLPYIKEGFPISILSTPYTLIASMLPMRYASLWNQIYYAVIIILIILFGYMAYRLRKQPIANQNTILAMTMLFALFFTPYALLHDLLLVIPILILLSAGHEEDRRFLLLVVSIYVGMLILPLVGFTTKTALTGLIPIAIFIELVQRAVKPIRA